MTTLGEQSRQPMNFSVRISPERARSDHCLTVIDVTRTRFSQISLIDLVTAQAF